MHISMEKHLKNCEEVGRRDMKVKQILDFYNGSFESLFYQVREIMNYLQRQIDEEKENDKHN